jgi:hypothetical protein
MEALTGVDSLGMYLTGAASDGEAQPDPTLSLGGYRSYNEARGIGALVTQSMSSLYVDNVTPANGEGVAYLHVVGTDLLRYTPPDGNAGDSVSILAGESKLLTGADSNKAVRVYRGTTGIFAGQMTFRLVEVMSGVLSMENISNADRVAGATHYRAIILKAHGTNNVHHIYLWTPLTTQAVFSLASEEVDSGGAIQTIANEDTAPTGVSWVTSLTKGGGLYIPELLSGDSIGVWIRRVFPVGGSGDVEERVGLGVCFSLR